MPAMPKLIAHRGESANYPENSLSALRAALEAGADGVEFDIQFTGDGQPVVLHDRDLRRTGGLRYFIDECDSETIRAGLPVHEPERFGDDFRGECVPTLEAAVAAIRAFPESQARVFAEIKTETIGAVGASTAVRRVIHACHDLGERLTIIGSDAGILRTARSMGAQAVGWLVTPSSILDREQARVLVPDYLFADRAGVQMAGTNLWSGAWHWIVYEVNAITEARQLAEAGVWGVETSSITRLRARQ